VKSRKRLRNVGGHLSRPVERSRSFTDAHVGEFLLSPTELGEPRLLPTLAVLGAAALYATLPARFIVGSSAGLFSVARLLVPALTVVLLLLLLAAVPRGRLGRWLGLGVDRVLVGRRILAFAVIALISAANAAAIVVLVHLLVNGAQTVASALLRASIHIWCVNVLVFALWYWELDNGGPVARRSAEAEGRDFLFPQQTLSETYPHWQPLFLDYLYLSFTNATAFSPTDTMPLSRWAKMLMLVESAASLLLAIMVAARAVNILK
jgi:hypothetical protein